MIRVCVRLTYVRKSDNEICVRGIFENPSNVRNFTFRYNTLRYLAGQENHSAISSWRRFGLGQDSDVNGSCVKSVPAAFPTLPHVALRASVPVFHQL
ncbi:hypothetical protein E2C01_079634 [Portunus trituberculatus]|uniref:Uncharacterized protein n=1 Tax=Portunus trituberculatus TaxID=210409 RepID=A0A5B7IR45_PORTR|nr:hypothetical protein [Portunus trituberculatus]